MRRLKPPSGPVRWGLYQGGSHCLELDHHEAKFAERQHSCSESGLCRLKCCLGMNPSFPIPNWQVQKKRSAACMDKCSLSQIKTVQFEISYSSSLQKNYKRTDVQNDRYFYVTMVLPTLPQIPVELFWGVIKRLAKFHFQI